MKNDTIKVRIESSLKKEFSEKANMTQLITKWIRLFLKGDLK